ncbi:hypothetical protein GPX89_04935 [Nocardia sp. ET3-3]|uniref:Uncharacterized protein n=1 Tax=Nocardia terrae TaxID=2675851 RepID=A0A7K1URR6_9NOCA|nr:hypothetical protein [Nocardia terrae]MVU76588.1 hypothetical protein [Nocardia terrae]
MDTASGVLDPADTADARVRDFRADCVAELRAAIGIVDEKVFVELSPLDGDG